MVMTIKEKRIKIAEACGWTATVDEDQFWRATRADGSYTSELWCSQDNVWSVGIPDYLSDLNACHEMEKTIWESSKWYEYVYQLDVEQQNGSQGWGHATASQRAEAFGKTMNLW